MLFLRHSYPSAKLHALIHLHPCANLTAEQTVPLAQSNAIYNQQNDAESALTVPSASFVLPLPQLPTRSHLPQPLSSTPNLGHHLLYSPVRLAHNCLALRHRGGFKRSTPVNIAYIAS